MNRKIVWAFGGGVQSVGIAVLIEQEKLPVPDYIGMADTSYERQAVWDYNEEYTFPMLAKLGVPVDVISHKYSKVDIVAKNGDLLLPVFTGGGGKLPTFCSNEWKQRVFRRRLRELGYGPKNPVKKWLGYSLDEYDRMKQTDLKWMINDFPLLLGYGLRLSRRDLIQAIKRHGWPLPPSSACDFCPQRDDKTWQEIKDNEPDTFKNAVERDKWLREEEQLERWGETYIHRSLVPLDEVDFSKPGDMPLFTKCGSSCWT